MNTVNSYAAISCTSEVSEIALDKIKNILVSFEKKKRNLEKRKNKLDEYKKKINLNEDQQAALSKYPEVVSNLELLEELTVYTNLQLRDAEKSFKKIKKQEKVDKKRSEIHLVEFILKNYSIIKRIGSNERIRRKVIFEGVATEKDIAIIMAIFNKINLSNQDNWRMCAEHLLGLYDPDLITHDGKLLNVEESLVIINNLTKIDWLWCEDFGEFPSVSIHVSEAVENLQPVPLPCLSVEHPLEEDIYNVKSNSDNPKLNFVFLHDSMVKNDSCKLISENEYNSHANEVETKPNLQTAGDFNSTWQSDSRKREDVFSSATRSQFMQTEITKNAWTKNSKISFNDCSGALPSFSFMERRTNDNNFRRNDESNFISNPGLLI